MYTLQKKESMLELPHCLRREDSHLSRRCPWWCGSWGGARCCALHSSCHQEKLQYVPKNNLPLSFMRRWGWTIGLVHLMDGGSFVVWTGSTTGASDLQQTSAGGWVCNLGVSVITVTFLNVKSFLYFGILRSPQAGLNNPSFTFPQRSCGPTILANIEGTPTSLSSPPDYFIHFA